MTGVLLMLCVAVLGSIDAVIVRALSPAVHPFIIGFTRALFGFLAFLPFLLARPAMLRSHYRWMHVLRAALKLASLIAFFAAFGLASLADVTAIAFTAPIFVTLGAWLFLSERPRALRVAGVVCGFIGVIVVLGPGHEGGISRGLIFALVGALLTALIQLILKPMARHDSTQTLVAWNLIATVPLAAILALFVWVTPTAGQMLLLAIQGVLGALSMWLVTRAFMLAEASLLAPIDFLRLPIVAGLGYVLFGQIVPVTTWIGGALIFAATMLMAQSARSRRPTDL